MNGEGMLQGRAADVQGHWQLMNTMNITASLDRYLSLLVWWAMNTMNITASPLGHMSSTINILLLLAGNRLIHGSFLCRQEERRLARGREKKEAEPSIKRIKEMK
jgi:hypothetical protein|uniref:Uncharacterized protein n=1 Tax=Picea glauca TaxID=3330 RepID=A0A117NH05_PICGL|nr:hypothetical protein ABT39_MTgene5789 [Picea glauca]QHR90435.1 hypothetical protein Q903MT_gene4459 [Picea sitchensis]